ncbi:MAG: hypothetical protein GY773_34625, partial [Actinomycetia bacterium]|nr:hypothetical protein [Actinomycetes bacterium]
EEPIEKKPAPEPIVKKKLAPARKDRLWKWAGLGTAGTGAVSLGLGIVFGLEARSVSNNLSNNDDDWNADDRALIDKGKRAQTLMLVFTSVGVAAMAGGAYLYYRGHQVAKERPSAGVVWAPRLTPTSASFTVAGWF